MDVINTMVTLSFGPAPTPAGPSYALQFLNLVGIPAVTVDGQLLPQTIILVMFAAWGVWHWALMAKNSYEALKYRYEQYKEEQNEP